MNKVLHQYDNGNYTVVVYTDGTKERWSKDDDLRPQFPETMDVKITNYCAAGCAWCHEKSTTNENSYPDLSATFDLISQLPAGCEIAVGGGDPLTHPDLHDFCRGLTDKGIIMNLTVNELNIKDRNFAVLSERLVDAGFKGVGLSYHNGRFLPECVNENHVIHLIIGLHSPQLVQRLSELGYKKILLLGYKTFGRGIEFVYDKNQLIVNNNIESWKQYFNDPTSNLHGVQFSFDNLAVEQINPKTFMAPKDYDKHYLGEDGLFSMYLDGNLNQFARCSFSPLKKDYWTDIREMFQYIRSDVIDPLTTDISEFVSYPKNVYNKIIEIKQSTQS